MPKTVPRRRGSRGWLDETSVAYVMFELRRIQEHLHYLACNSTADRKTARVLLTHAHIEEAIGILIAIPHKRDATDAECGGACPAEVNSHAVLAFDRSCSSKSDPKFIKN
jgi:hypothetical protein